MSTEDSNLATTVALNSLPEPFVPREVDLRKKDYMPLYGDILLSSAGWNLAPLECRGAMVQLWWHAFTKQVPAGSLPNDEGTLIAIAGLQARPELWTRHRVAILRGFKLCSDGRLYHEFLADLIHELLENRRFKASEIRNWRERKRGEQAPDKSLNAKTEADVDAKPAGVGADLSTRYDTIRYETTKEETSSLVPRATLLEAVATYNTEAEKWGWPVAVRISQVRAKKLAARLREAPGDGWRLALERAGASGFLTRGEGAREGWTPDLDFFVQEKSFNRLREGYYDDRKRTGSNRGGASGDRGSHTATALRGILGSGGADKPKA